MAIELRLEKSDDEPWGFRLTGGSDFEVPLTVVKICERSPAHKCGLQIGDVLIKINNAELMEMTHSEAQEIITQSGATFIMGVYRGQLSDVQCTLIAEEQSNEEVFHIMEGSIPIDYPERPYIEEQVQQKQESLQKETCFIQHDLNLTDEEIHSIINPEKLETKISIKSEEQIQTKNVVQEFQNTVYEEKSSCELINEQYEHNEINSTQYNASAEEMNVEISENIENKIKQEEIHTMKEIMKTQQQTIEDSNVQMLEEKQQQIMQETNMQKIEEQTQEKMDSVMWGSQIKVQQSEVLKAVSDYLSDMEMESRKWSTFMQKPNHPKPKLKVEQTQIPKSQYRVVIRTKKDLEAEIVAKKVAEEEALAAELAAVQAAEEAAIAAEEAARVEEEMARIAAEEAELILQETVAAAETAAELDLNENVVNRDEDEDESKSEATSKHISGKDAVLTVEQQLAQVKEQLLALSELPSTIQMTLGIITEQLKKLAKEAQPEGLNDARDDELSNADNTETEDEVTELLALDGLSIVEEESEHVRIESELEEFLMEESRIEAEEINQVQLDEEEEVRRIEEERSHKKEKEQMAHRPSAPLERPIILPGGRKWSEPDDAVRSVRQPKLSDDKIDQTISSYYEVITGKTIGINFLKYQPPAKNLDHLQRSDVYKMVHDLDAPPRGIIARAEKVAAVQDYLVTSNGGERKQLPPQMER